MKIVDIQVTEFRATSNSYPTRWGYSYSGQAYPTTASLTRIITLDAVHLGRENTVSGFLFSTGEFGG